MPNAYIGEVRLFGGNFAPIGWHLCDGSSLSVSEYATLYSLIGTTYGGNGTTDFRIPDLRGRVPVGQGQGEGLTNRVLGQQGGASTVTLSVAEIPSHTHTFFVSTDPATATQPPENGGLAASATTTPQPVAYTPAAQVGTTTPLQAMSPSSISSSVGYGRSHDNLMPYQAVNYIICTNGLYPTFQ